MRVSYSPGYVADIPDSHVFPMKKFSGLHAYLTQNGIVSESEVVEPSMVDISNLITAHTSRYANAVWTGALDRKEIRRMGLPWSKSLAIRSRLAVQGTINAALMALQEGLAGNLAGGTHHSMPDHGEGFCVYNDVAVAIKVLKQSMWVNKVLVIDCDVHQGNGTAYIFRNDPDVFTFSIHGEKNYPFKKPPSDLDIGLPDKTGDSEYHQTLIDALDHIFDQFTPDLVFYLGGIDPLETDHFGRLALTLKGLRERDRIVIETVTRRDLPLTLLLSGGYAPSVEETVIAHAQMYEVAKEMGF
ncbi:histone deacetylase family protein [Gracilimonas tropica]|uniref:histone deacetylase family protein n=1 Tax=Gracilimonas tropica TaxID=454600 RepID=UPI0003A5694B|nr:histone deacetylase [Gracilimonas tropica]